jgi:anti-sigma regulatory factor (Ser/Thr protein kinase)
MADEITLTLPREPDFQSVAHLVLGGLAARLNLTLENLENLQLALTALLGRGDGRDAAPVTVRMTVHEDALEIVVGPLDRKVLDAVDRGVGAAVDIRRVLESTVDDILIDGEWVRLTKQVALG